MKRFILENIKSVIVILSIPIWLNAGASCAHAEVKPRFKIAIIDTGYDPKLIYGPKLKLCKKGHFDFNTGKPEITSSHPHGTQIAALIAKNLVNVDYCAIIYNICSQTSCISEIPVENVVSAFYKASNENLIAVNASYSGTIRSVAEREAVKDAAKRISRIYVAAGNDQMNLDYQCLVFPACFDIPNMYPVGALTSDSKYHLSKSNHGRRIKLWFNGVFSKGIQGTSYAAPRALASEILTLNRAASK